MTAMSRISGSNAAGDGVALAAWTAAVHCASVRDPGEFNVVTGGFSGWLPARWITA
ncbi:MAG TPA: hypothetical protein VIU11_26300 [Nakamurella sp.]